MFTKRLRRSVSIVRAKGCPFETQDQSLPSVCQSMAGRTGNVLCSPPGSWPRSPKRLVRVSPDTHNLHPHLSVTRLAWLIPVFSPQTNTRKKKHFYRRCRIGKATADVHIPRALPLILPVAPECQRRLTPCGCLNRRPSTTSGDRSPVLPLSVLVLFVQNLEEYLNE